VINRVQKTIEKYRLLEKGDRIIVAVSGGPDSVALLGILQKLSPVYDLTLKVAHLNHGLRGEESDREEAFVGNLSASLGLPFSSKKIEMIRIIKKEKMSLEDACRKERYGYLEALRRDEGCQKVALGQHRDDQAETVLIRFLRGSGLEGLRGMVPLRDGIFIRPLIERSRKEILAYLEQEGMRYMKDSSNDQETCLRNRIRRRLIPELLSQYNPRLAETIGRMAEIFREEDDYLRVEAGRILKQWGCAGTSGKISIPLGELQGRHPAMRRRIIKEILLTLSPSKNGIGYRHIDAVLNIAAGARPNARLDMPFQVRIRREYDRLYIEKEENREDRLEAYAYDVRLPGEVQIPEAGRRMVFVFVKMEDVSFPGRRGKQVAFMDADKIAFPLVVRNRRPGDRIEPLGMTGAKKVKDLLIESKIPPSQRNVLPMLTDRSSVLWIAGVRLSNRVKITEETKRVLKIEIY
jgi:tRNA(Ile)-lysidine synthase